MWRFMCLMFPQEGFYDGMLFSKPDWHCEWFWNPYFATANRRINYKKRTIRIGGRIIRPSHKTNWMS